MAGSNISITPAAQSLTISATGGGLALPFSGTVSSAGDAFAVTNTGAGNAGHFQISNTSSPGPMAAVLGEINSTQSNARGIMGLITNAAAGTVAAGVWGGNSSTGSSGFGVIGVHGGTGGAGGRLGAGVFFARLVVDGRLIGERRLVLLR